VRQFAASIARKADMDVVETASSLGRRVSHDRRIANDSAKGIAHEGRLAATAMPFPRAKVMRAQVLQVKLVRRAAQVVGGDSE
jgi:hypothetical protein